MTTPAQAMLQAKLDRGLPVILDGGTGTELQRRGATMDDGAWCALATLSHPDLLRAVHADYVTAGADIVTANTFSTLPHLLDRSGRGSLAPELLRKAVAITKEAASAAGRPVAVAGSISTTRMPRADGWYIELAEEWPLARAERDLVATARILADAGCDLLMLEMIGDLAYGHAAYRAARATGLPVWVGVSARMGPDGHLVTFDEGGPRLDALLDGVVSWRPDAIGIMHSTIPDTGPALEMLLERWSGPRVVYPEAGWFQMPNWQFVEIEPEGFALTAAGWRRVGASVLGGCCGLGPGHIAALTRTLLRPAP